ncbi:MAG TPA: aldehyde dehydrogenase family protein, partial [Chitinophagales bacterium]|nr:aldehyde dehydrogenase family protein [Chitinophagales bacterium]
MMIQAEPQTAIVPQIQDISHAISDAIQQQRAFFATNQTKNIDFRIAQLQKLRKAIEEHEPEIFEALQQDLGKHYMESFGTEVGLVYAELDHCITNLRQWAKDKKVSTPMFHFKAESFVQYEPYGIVLIIGPWNYPFQLSLLPLVGAIAAGNCAILKPSELASHTAAVTRRIIEKVFTPKFVTLFEGGPDVAQALLKNKFDYIFFTGSTSVGKIVYKAAAEHLTPVTLELGGKSPCFVDKTADVDLSAKRIAWGKFLNVGQTCIAPDYILVHESVKDLLIERLKKYITDFYGQNPRQSAYYGKIINERNFKRLQHL